jgi:hypothetical protein
VPEHFEGVSSARDDDAGFRAAANAAVSKYTDKHGVPKADDEPVRLDVVNMHVRVHNPIHDYIVVLRPHH